MIVISDTPPINYLVLIGQVDLLPKLFRRILIPPGVLSELKQPGSPGPVQVWMSSIPAWLEVRAPSGLDPDIRLRRGEVEAISLACELHAAEVLVDDMEARKAAVARGLRVAGTLLVLDRAAQQELVYLPEALERLLQTNFRVPAALIVHLLDSDAQRRHRRK
jgi:predicted nucleic acid-binding protein